MIGHEIEKDGRLTDEHHPQTPSEYQEEESVYDNVYTADGGDDPEGCTEDRR